MGVGYGTYAMSDLKAYQTAQLRALPVEAEATSSFPPYWIYTLSAGHLMKDNVMIGVSGTVGSTGSRVYYRDYSGKIEMDQILRFTTLGLHIGFWDALKERKLYLSADLNPGVTFTSMKLRNFQALGSYGQSEAIEDVRSMNVVVQPTLTLTRRFGRLAINCYAGYHLTILSGKLRSKEKKDAYLVDDRGPVKADWSGLRIGMSASVFLSGKGS